MTDAQPDILAVFNAAVACGSDDERRQYLDETCGSNAPARARVEALLRAHFEAGEFLGGQAPAGEATIDLPGSDRPGTQIGAYKLLQEIGEGGMGVVYMAEQVHPVERRVALKLIKPGMDSRQVIARFEAERQALAMMDHPNIAKVLDAGTTETGRPYFVMELIKGTPLTRYCDEHHLTLDDRLELFVVVCNAVHHAHQKGIIHRDIKPTNVLVAEYDDHPVPKIIDFGVAKAVDHRLTEKTMFTEYGQLVGTVEYMSPEQAKLNQLDIDTRSDIYSLGVLLYELLTSETPFDRKRLASAAHDELLRIIREEEPPQPSVRLSTSHTLPAIAANRHTEPKKLSMLVRGELDWIAMKALEKERGRRYESSHSLAADIERFLSGQPVEAHPPSTAYRVRKFVRRYRASVGTALTLLAILILGAIGTTTGWLSASAVNKDLEQKKRELETEVVARREAEGKALSEAERAKQAALAETASRQQADIARKAAQEESARRRWLLYTSDMHLAAQAWESGNLGQLEVLLRRHVPRGDQLDLRGFEWRYLWRNWKIESDLDDIIPVNASRFWTWLALSSDGSRLAIGNPVAKPAVVVIDMKKREVVDTFGSPSLHWSGVGLALSNDGKTIAYRSPSRQRELTAGSTGDRAVSCVSVRTIDTREERSIDTETGFPTVAFSPDSMTLAVGQSETTVWLWDVNAWQTTAKLEGLQGRAHALAFSPDGQYLAAGDDTTVRVWNTATGQLVWQGRGNSGGILSVAYSPKGDFLATGSRDNLVVIWDATTGHRLQTLVGGRDEVRAVAFSSDENLLGAGCRDGRIRLWRLPDYTEHDVVAGFAGLYGIIFLPDGRLVFPAEGGRLVTRKVPAAGFRRLSVPAVTEGVFHAAFSFDGTTLCAMDGGPSRCVSMWKLTNEGARALDPLVVECDATALAVSSRNQLAVGNSASATVLLYDLATRQLVAHLSAPHEVGVACTAFCVDGKRLAIGCDNGRIIVWDVDSRRVVVDRIAHQDKVKDLRFCDNGATLLTGGLDRLAKLWDVNQGNSVLTFDKHPSSILAVDFVNDGTLLATGTFADDAIIRLFDRSSSNAIGELRGHLSAVRSVKFLGDGKALASAGGDRTVRLWDIATREERFVFDGGTCIFEFLAVSPDGTTLAAGGRDGTIRLYRAATPEEVQADPTWWRLPGEEPED